MKWRFSRRWGLTLAAFPLAVFVLLGLIGPWIAPADPFATDLAASLSEPSADHLLGTDQLGRDQLSRLLHGARTSLGVAALVLAITVVTGMVVGTVAGYAGGLVDRLAVRLIDFSLALPALVIALAVIGIRGPGVANLVLALALTGWAPYARVARARVVSARRSTHVDALRVLGARRSRILRRHLAPVALGPVLVYASTDVGMVVLSVATLSFLGVGITPPQAEWGQMLVDARPFLDSAWWLALPPGLAITAVVLSSNLLGERLALPGHRTSILRSLFGERRPHSCERVTTPARYAVRGLSVDFHRPGAEAQRVVSAVSYRVDAGETLGLVGESGSGKTVSLLAPLGLLNSPATVSGSAVLGNTELIALPERALQKVRGRRVGVVFQDPLAALNPLRTVGAQVDESVGLVGKQPRPDRRRRTLELLELAGLPEPEQVAASYPHQLSGGMGQRVLIAMALAGEPDVLIADEPTSALDVTTQAEVVALLRRLRDELGLAIILVSHDLAVVAELADTIAVMHRGHIVEQGPADEVLTAPRHPYTRRLLAAVPRLGAPPGTRFSITAETTHPVPDVDEEVLTDAPR
jgi:peptide/nickel transport system permease protein